ncbi:OmpA/MotB family protein [Halomonas saccharevitans]|uniref:Chemotaxis protein MotB n=1 Tax=Halomonas saccharevitans TaxID=416872 RepID=A0A1I6Z1T4_9GAMM|nr:OmpA family protein [Halomonas saccharevitans]SFT56663.1 chemotaxis protein MotB [Halomonas saccharevitans]
MHNRDISEALSPPGQGEGDSESWLMSYLDVLTLLITLFVLLLSMAGNGQAESGGQYGGQAVSPAAYSASLAVAGGMAPQAAGLKPRHDGLQPRFKGLEMEGVSVAEGKGGITLRIDNNLLFASGQARLTEGGRRVLQGMVETLQTFDGRISVEGHTDNVPIATRRFPSNWELSTDRAISVLRHLVKSGLSEARLRAIGYADTQALESNDTRAGRAANRRVELLLTRDP